MIIGADVGTQSLKVAVLDSSLRIVGQSAKCYRPSFPKPGWVEQAPDLWTDALGPAIAEALKSADAAPADIQAIGLCGQLDGCVAVDANGTALSPCLTWMDRRATAEIGDIPCDLVRAECGLVLDPSHLGAKARWLTRHLPAGTPIARFHQPVSYVVEQLTGTAIIDHALASTSMLYSLDRRSYDPALLDRFDLSEKQLPKIADAQACAGTLNQRGAALTGLPVGMKVAVGTGDDFGTPLGAGFSAPGRIAVVLGTGEVVGGLHPIALRDESGLLETHAYPGGAFFIENPGWLSGGAVAWISQLLNVSDLATLNALAAEVPAGTDGLSFMPALTGAMAPEWQPTARGCFYGMTPAHGRGHMVRAVLEGCAFAMRDVIDRLDQMGVAAGSLLLIGGGAHSRLWSQMRADIMQRPVELPHCIDSAPVGAALLAAVAGGVVRTLDEAVSALSVQHAEIEPDARQADAYDEAYGNYRRLFRSLRPLFAEQPRN
ncbi:MAG TPA: FGGY family carbohydrate kinase [Dongiaceae bacterium]|jgi:xylulokinase|nr:FGGY family carbohydrate kinase [Dongiaceae bacterium]